jgi:hypothetical protein
MTCPRAAKCLGATLLIAAQVLCGAMLVDRGTAVFAIVALGFIAVIVVTMPRWIIPLVLAGAFGSSHRLASGSADLSLADGWLVLAVVAVVPFVPWGRAQLRPVFRYVGSYLLILAVTVAANPSRRAGFEWAHRLTLVAGAITVGYVIVQQGWLRRALRAYVLVACIFAGAALVDLANNPRAYGLPTAAYPFGMQKNPAGLLLAIAVLILLITPAHVALSRSVRSTSLVLLFAGIVACQSRGTSVALVGVLLIRMFRERKIAVSPLAVLGSVLLVGMVFVTFNALRESSDADSRFNSVNSRITTYDASLELWRSEPVLGAGLRYWNDPVIGPSHPEPHDLVVAALGETGVVGLLGVAYLFASTGRLLRSIPGELSALTLYVLAMKVVASLFDIFWVAGTMTVPWLLVGITLASRAADTTSRRPAEQPRVRVRS